MCYTASVLVPCGFLLTFDVLRGELVRFHLGLCVANVGLVVLVRVLVGMLCPNVGPPSEVAQGPHLALSLGYAPSEMVSLVGGANLVEIYVSFLCDAVYLSPNFVGGIVGVGFRRAWVRSAAVRVVASYEESLGKDSDSTKNCIV